MRDALMAVLPVATLLVAILLVSTGFKFRDRRGAGLAIGLSLVVLVVIVSVGLAYVGSGRAAISASIGLR